LALPKRQVILVAFMIASVGYGAFELLGGRPGGKDAAPVRAVETQEASKTAEMINQMLDKAPMSESEQYRVELLRRETLVSPFYAADTEFYFPGAGQAAAGDSLLYKGYVKVGDKVLAVINGVEYAVGEEVETTGYVVASIQQNYVELSRGEGDERGRRKLPLTEDALKPVDVKVGR
jgi:hypothetical protein